MRTNTHKAVFSSFPPALRRRLEIEYPKLKVPVRLQHGGGFPNPQLHQQEVLVHNSDDDDEQEDSDDNDDEEKIKNSQKNLQNTKSHKKNKKSHKNLGSMLRTAATKKTYKIPINPPKKINKKY